MWLWDLTKVINTGVLHEGAIPLLCLYSQTQSKDQPLYRRTGAVSQRRATLQGVARHLAHKHMHTDVNAKTLTSASDNSQTLEWLEAF